MTARSVNQPATLNEMYLLASQWLKTTGAPQSGLASTLVVKLDMPDQGPQMGKRQAKNKDEDTTNKPKPQRDMSKVKCFNCGKLGHILPNRSEKATEREVEDEDETEKIKAKAFVSWEDDWAEEEAAVEDAENQAGTYITYQVCNGVGGEHRFKNYDVLLDNQADVSVIHPRLLRQVMKAEQPITVRGIGGKQLEANHTGYLEEFFCVYASMNAMPNVLSLAEVEDKYAVSYVPG